jgi:uncharacterized membrane protein
MIPWYAYALASIFFSIIFIIARKKALLKVHSMNFESARTLTMAVLCLVLIPFLNLNLDIKSILLIYFVSVLSTIGILLTSKAFRHKDISLIFPLGNFKPAFVAILAFLFLSEAIKTKQIIGIVILLLSAYLLESNHHISDFYAPIKNFLRSKYHLYFVLAIFIFSINSVLDKFILSSFTDIFTYFFLLWIFIALNFNIIHLLEYGYKDTINCFRKTTYLPVLVGVTSIIKNLLVFKAFTLTYVSLVTPVLMLKTLFIVLIGGKFFHEKYLFFRLVISAFMLMGTYLIIF